MLTYQITKETRHSADNSCVFYGIRCGDLEIKGISFDKDAVERLVERCNRLQLERVHLVDVVRDFLLEEVDLICRVIS
nr:DUF6514 family protein [uncultured Solibaculum sp.]